MTHEEVAHAIAQALYDGGVEDVYVEEDASEVESVFRVVVTTENHTVYLPVLDGEGPAVAPRPAPDWQEMFARYAEVVVDNEGVFFLDASQWPADQWAAISTLVPQVQP